MLFPREEADSDDSESESGNTTGGHNDSAETSRDAATLSTAANPPLDAPSPDFEAVDKFGGLRAGYVYKQGQRGLGYYLDSRVIAPPTLLSMKEARQQALRQERSRWMARRWHLAMRCRLRQST